MEVTTTGEHGEAESLQLSAVSLLFTHPDEKPRARTEHTCVGLVDLTPEKRAMLLLIINSASSPHYGGPEGHKTFTQTLQKHNISESTTTFQLLFQQGFLSQRPMLLYFDLQGHRTIQITNDSDFHLFHT